jgi:HEAT repeat protein
MDVVAILGFACFAAGAFWAAIAALAIAGRLEHDRHAGTGQALLPLTPRSLRRLARRAGGHRTEASRWRRIHALRELAARREPVVHSLLERALRDRDDDVAGAAVRVLGELARDEPWALGMLIDELQLGAVPRSRVAAQLERLAPDAAGALKPLLGHHDPRVRFWGVTLLADYPGVATQEILALATDSDANVRAAAAETLGDRAESQALAALTELLDDREWFVRAHAARAASAVGGLTVAGRIVPLLADRQWWVRVAAKEALCFLGPAVAPVLAGVLESDDRFARNGAAEVLQDVGVVDALERTNESSPMLQRIYAAGEEKLEIAARSRVAASDELSDEEMQAA